MSSGGLKPAGPMKSNLTTLFRQHIPLLFASQESDAWRGGSSEEAEGVVSDPLTALKDLET